MIDNNENSPASIQKKCRKMSGGCGAPGCVYGLAFIGALIYFLQQAHTFESGVLGVLKALVWPAIVIYKALGFLGL